MRQYILFAEKPSFFQKLGFFSMSSLSNTQCRKIYDGSAAGRPEQ